MSLVWDNFIMMYLGVALFIYLVFEADLVSWIYGLIISIKFGKILPFFLSFPPLWGDTSSSLMLWSFLFSLFYVLYFEWFLLMSYIHYIFLLWSNLLLIPFGVFFKISGFVVFISCSLWLFKSIFHVFCLNMLNIFSGFFVTWNKVIK